jgi:hypothetical protein
VDGPKLIAGAIVGIVLAVLGLVLFAPDQSPASGAYGDPATEVPEPTTQTTVPWVASGEVQFESTVLVPTEVIADDGVAVLQFDLATLAPRGGTASLLDGDPVFDALPER